MYKNVLALAMFGAAGFSALFLAAAIMPSPAPYRPWLTKSPTPTAQAQGVAVLATPTAYNVLPAFDTQAAPLSTPTAQALSMTATNIAVAIADNGAESARLDNEAKALALRERALGLELTAGAATLQAGAATATRQAQADSTAAAIVSAQLTARAVMDAEAPARAQNATIAALWGLVPGIVIFGACGAFLALLILWFRTREPMVVEADEEEAEPVRDVISPAGSVVVERQEQGGFVAVAQHDWTPYATPEQLAWVAEWVGRQDNFPVAKMYGEGGGPFTRAQAVRFLAVLCLVTNPAGRALATRMSDGQTVINPDGKRYFAQVVRKAEQWKQK